MQNREWNVKAGLAIAGFVAINAFAGVGVYTGGLTFKEAMAAVGAVNGLGIGWLFGKL